MRLKIKIDVFRVEANVYKYIGTNMNTNEKMFQHVFENCTEGMVEFVGAIHGLMLIKKSQELGDVYIKNKFIKESIENKQYKFTSKGEKSENINEYLKKCLSWLLDQKSGINVEVSIEDEQIDISDESKERKGWYNKM